MFLPFVLVYFLQFLEAKDGMAHQVERLLADYVCHLRQCHNTYYGSFMLHHYSPVESDLSRSAISITIYHLDLNDSISPHRCLDLA